MKQISERVQLLNDKSANNDGEYILYWMQMFKRTTHNHALKFAIEQANERRLPLVVYEGLKFYYPWTSDRFHTYILEGIEKNAGSLKNSASNTFFICRKTMNLRNKPSPKSLKMRR